MSGILDVINRCMTYEDEQEWFDYKENWFEPGEIGQYISTLSNAAAMAGESFGYLIWGVRDKTSTMYAVREFGNMCLLLALDKVLDYCDTLIVCLWLPIFEIGNFGNLS